MYWLNIQHSYMNAHKNKNIGQQEQDMQELYLSFSNEIKGRLLPTMKHQMSR